MCVYTHKCDIYLPIYMYTTFVCVYTHTNVISIYPSIHPSIYLSIYPSIYLSVYIYGRLTEELHNKHVRAQHQRLRARHPHRMHPPQVSELLLCPHGHHLARASRVAVAEAEVARHIPGGLGSGLV